MSFAAAICSMVSDGILPKAVDFSLVWFRKRCQIYAAPRRFPNDEKNILDTYPDRLPGTIRDRARARYYSQRRCGGSSVARRNFAIAPAVSAPGGENSREQRRRRNHF